VLARLTFAYERLAIGLQVLQAREDISGYSGFNEREFWMQEGLRGWSMNPLFGQGVEAFRAPYGITSHSTPVDLLYNTGLIGFCLFYAIFISLAWRLLIRPGNHDVAMRAVLLVATAVYGFITLSGTVFYLSFMGAFLGVSCALLRPRPSRD
jgi:O-antigen ligase